VFSRRRRPRHPGTKWEDRTRGRRRKMHLEGRSSPLPPRLPRLRVVLVRGSSRSVLVSIHEEIKLQRPRLGRHYNCGSMWASAATHFTSGHESSSLVFWGGNGGGAGSRRGGLIYFDQETAADDDATAEWGRGVRSVVESTNSSPQIRTNWRWIYTVWVFVPPSHCRFGIRALSE
jgi:hypothetical protein